MTQIVVPDLTLVLVILSICGVVFSVYLYFRNPQIKTDQTTTKLSDDIKDLQRQITDVKETHLKSVETDLKTLTTAVNELSKTVVRLSTIIDERIPKNNL